MRILGQGFRIHLDPPFSPGFGEQNEPLLECIVPKLKCRLHLSNYVVVGDFYLIVHMSLISVFWGEKIDANRIVSVKLVLQSNRTCAAVGKMQRITVQQERKEGRWRQWHLADLIG